MPPTVQLFFEMKVRPDRSRAGICLWRTIGHLVRAINCHERGIPSGRFGQHFQRMEQRPGPRRTVELRRPIPGDGRAGHACPDRKVARHFPGVTVDRGTKADALVGYPI